MSEGSSRRERVLSGGVGPANPDKGAFYTVGDVSKAESTLTRSDQKRCPQGSYCKVVTDTYAQPADMDLASVKTKIHVLVNALKVFTVLKAAPKHEKPVEVHLTIVRGQFGSSSFGWLFSYASPTKHLVGALGYPEEVFTPPSQLPTVDCERLTGRFVILGIIV